MQEENAIFGCTFGSPAVSSVEVMPKGVLIFGKKLAEARQKRFLTQLQLGELLGVTDENVGRIERSEVAGINAKRFPKLASGLGMTVEEAQRTLIAPDHLRPKQPASRTRAGRIALKLSADHRAAFEGKARKRGMTLEDWALSVLLAAIEEKPGRADDALTFIRKDLTVTHHQLPPEPSKSHRPAKGRGKREFGEHGSQR